MRAALERSIAVRRQADVHYERGSIVICTSCARPLYRLERGISLGEKAGRSVTAFAPVTVADLETLRARPDVDAGVRALLNAEPSLRAYADRIDAPRTGRPALCPFCQQVFVQGRTAEDGDTRDRAFVWELVTIPPTTGRQGLAAGAQDLWRNV
jgi:hypothetical protein